MSDANAYTGQIMLFGGSYAPRDWAICAGQLMSISEHPDLFAVLGVTYGGDGVNNFALPDMRGRVPIHKGEGHGLTNRLMGQMVGREVVELSLENMPGHTHVVQAASSTADTDSPSGMELAETGLPIYSDQTPSQALSPQAVGITGGDQPHYNMMPFLCMNFCICTKGVYPSRN